MNSELSIQQTQYWRAFLQNTIIALIAVFFGVQNSMAQKENGSRLNSLNPTFEYEIFLIIEDPVFVNVWVDGVMQGNTRESDSDVCDDREYDWIADTDPDSPLSCPIESYTDLLPDQLYELEFEVSGDSTYTYYFLHCRDSYSSLPLGDFYCLEGYQEWADLNFIYRNGAMEVDVDLSGWGDYTSNFTDDNWLLPHYSYDLFPPFNARKVSFYLATQPGSTYTLTDSDLVVAAPPSQQPNDKWTWDDTMTLEFPASRKLIVEGNLEVEDATFTSSGSNWGGVEVKDGGNATFKNVDILNVGVLQAQEPTQAQWQFVMAQM